MIGRFVLGLALLLAAPVALPGAAQAQIKIGNVVTLTGPLGLVGKDQSDGFMLGMEKLNFTLGGLKAEVLTEDDQAKPEVGLQVVQKLIERDRVNLITGVSVSNVINAVFPRIIEAGIPFVGSNGGPSPIAGEQCSALFVSTAFQNDGGHEAMGQYAQSKGFAKVAIVAPNYQAGKDAAAGFKRFYKGNVVDEIFPGLTQVDFAAELAQIRSDKPDAVFVFMPGGLGIAFVKQYAQAGLVKSVPLLSTFTVDDLTLPAIRESALGMVTTSHWSSGMKTPASKAFVAAFEAKYKRTPSAYSAQGYDAAMLLDQGVKAAGDKWRDGAVLARAMRTATLQSLRGPMTFGVNGFPLQDYFAWKVEKAADGKLGFEQLETVLKQHKDAYIGSCKLAA